MTQNTSLERGMVGGYRAETPNYNRGQTGKGVDIHGKVAARKGEEMKVGGDNYAGKLKDTWSSALNAKSKFGNF